MKVENKNIYLALLDTKEPLTYATPLPQGLVLWFEQTVYTIYKKSADTE